MVDRQSLEELPNIGRNPFTLATLDPAVVQKGTFTRRTGAFRFTCSHRA